MEIASDEINVRSLGTRRRFLSLAGATAGVALAGCAAEGGEEDEDLEGEGRIDIELENRNAVAYDYRTVIERGNPDHGEGGRNTSSGTIPAETSLEVGSTFPLTRWDHSYSVQAGDGQISRT